MLGAGSDSGSVAGAGNTVSGGSPAGDRTNTDSNADNSSLAEEKVELLCNDQVLDPSMDLRTVCFHTLYDYISLIVRIFMIFILLFLLGQTFYLEKFSRLNTSLSASKIVRAKYVGTEISKVCLVFYRHKVS
mgnify:CR=1 FL=1